MKNFITATFLLLFNLCFIDNVFAAKNPNLRIAVLNFIAYNTSQEYADSIRDMLEVSLYKTNFFQILERRQINYILKEQNLLDKLCSDEDCAIKIGKLVSADKIIIGSINNIGNYTITIKSIDVKNGFIEYADSVIVKTDKEIMDATRNIAEIAAHEILKIHIGDKEYRFNDLYNNYYLPYYLKGFVPGWGQLYIGRTYKGIFFSSLFSISSLYTGYAIYDYRKKRKAYEDLKTGTNRDFDSKLKTSEDASLRAEIALWFTGAVYLFNWIDIIFFSKPDAHSDETLTKSKNLRDNFLYINLCSSSDSADELILTTSYKFRF